MIGEKIKYVCEVLLRDMTIVEIARKLETTDNTIRNLYKKDSVDSRYILRLSELAGVPVSYFFEEQENELSDKAGRYKSKKDGQTSREKKCLEELRASQKKIIELQDLVIKLQKKK